jgi:hypothetical protein
MMPMSVRIISILLLLCSNALGDIGVEIATVGFPGDGNSRYVYRRGCYAPVAVRLTLTNEDPRTIYIRLEQQDRDGDIIYTPGNSGSTSCPTLKPVLPTGLSTSRFSMTRVTL